MLKKIILILLTVITSVTFSFSVIAADKTELEIFTLPFGTPSYLVDTALESLFGELKHPNLSVKIKQTPGAFYIVRTWHTLMDKMKSGAVPYVLTGSTDAIIPFTTEGRPPFQKFPLSDAKVCWGTTGYINVFVTFDKNIKTPADFAGKKVGFAEKARIFMSSLPNMPYFNNGYGGYNKVKWQHLGSANSKDALLSGAIDVHWGTLVAKVKKDKQGRMIALYAMPAPPLLELMSSGRKLYFVQEDPDIVEKSTNPAKDLTLIPALVGKRALKGLDQDVWARGSQAIMGCSGSIPDKAVEDLVLTVWKNMKRLSTYQKLFMLYPESPYPVNVPKKYVHPGLISATKKLGFKVPKN